ncbi:hypothetical protein HMPREF9086_1973 [Enterobacter hormaechei ATCC 49162]|nr:hypothetical protein HMPREF9086_1973 [Enterobacter hormaechei ATCC 49162]
MECSAFYIKAKNNHYGNEENTDWPDWASWKEMSLNKGEYNC